MNGLIECVVFPEFLAQEFSGSTATCRQFFLQSVNVRIFYQPLTAPNALGLLTTQGTAAGIFPVGQRGVRSLSERWPAGTARGEVI